MLFWCSCLLINNCTEEYSSMLSGAYRCLLKRGPGSKVPNLFSQRCYLCLISADFEEKQSIPSCTFHWNCYETKAPHSLEGECLTAQLNINKKFIEFLGGNQLFLEKKETNNNRKESRHSLQSDTEKEDRTQDRKHHSKKKDRTLKRDSTLSGKKTTIGGRREYEHSEMLTDMRNVWQASKQMHLGLQFIAC